MNKQQYDPEPIRLLTVDAINDVLRGFIGKFLKMDGSRILIETRMSPRPMEGVYVTLWWKRQALMKQVVSDFEFVYNADTGEATTTGPNLAYCTVQVTVRGENAYNICSEIKYAMEEPARSFDLWGVLGYGGTGPVQDLSAVYGARIQQRAYFDFDFYCTFGRGYPAEWFDTSKWVINSKELIIGVNNVTGDLSA